MNKRELMREVAARSHRAGSPMTLEKATAAIELAIRIIVEKVEAGEQVRLDNLGIIERYPKQYRGQPYMGVRLKAAKPLRDRLNKG